MAPMNIRVSAEELQRSNQESVSLPGGGHLAWIGAFHQLHCVVGRKSRPPLLARQKLTDIQFVEAAATTH